MCVYVNSHKKNIKEIKKIIFEQFERIQNLTTDELINAKNYIEGDFILSHEDTEDLAEEIAFCELCGNSDDFETYVHNIKQVTLEDVKKTAKKYLTKDYSEVIIKQIK